jgi:hypothetical protein
MDISTKIKRIEYNRHKLHRDYYTIMFFTLPNENLGAT